MKKKYNPFKMWGSWVGLVIGISFLFFPKDVNSNLIIPNYFASIGLGEPLGILFPIVISIILPLVGFLIGYGIHSLIRKLRKRK